MSKLETITDNLHDGYNQLKKGTFRSSKQIQTERMNNEELRNKYFYTANVATYEHAKDGTVSFSLGDDVAFESVIGSENIGQFCNDLLEEGDHTLSDSQVKKLSELDKKHVVKVKYNDLRLNEHHSQLSYLEINTTNFDSLNDSEKALVNMVHGNDYKKKMEMLSDSGIKTTKIYMLSENYVKNNVKKGSSIARACWLGSFYYISYFGANLNSVGSHERLRGVNNSGAAGVNANDSEQTQKYTDIGIIKHFDENPIRDLDLANKLMGKLNDFYQSLKQ